MSELPLFITVDEAAAMLRLNRKTVYDMVRDGELVGAQKCKGTIRINREMMLASFAGGDVPPKQRRSSK